MPYILSLRTFKPTSNFPPLFMQSVYVWLVLVAVLGSLIGVCYYFRVIIKMYNSAVISLSGDNQTEERRLRVELAGGENEISVSPLHKIVLIITILLTLLLGIFPDAVIGLL